ncbi:Olfactory receptor 4F4 [Lemmus lemmus]
MKEVNQSVVSEFIFQGLCTSRELQIFFLLPFSILYLMTVVGNLFVVILIFTDHHLHSPMYFLLANLSFIDLCISSVTTPKLIIDLVKEKKIISYGGCMSQILFAHFFVGSEMVLLVTMAYDRYVAICRPLHYTSIMDRQKCIWLVVISWIIGFVHGISQLILILELPFCPNKIDSFYCDLPRVIKLACADTYRLDVMVIANSGILTVCSFVLLIVSYTVILMTIQRRPSDRSSKALSTLTAHITVVLLFFGPCVFIYAWPFPIRSLDKFLAVFYSVVTPLLNPIIYTLRNTEMKTAMRRLRQWNVNFWESLTSSVVMRLG